MSKYFRSSALPFFVLAMMACTTACMAGSIPDQDIREEYEFEKSIMERQDEVLLSQIVAATEQDAQSALQRLKNGEDFATIAAALSIDPNAKRNGGDIGWHTPTSLSEKIAPAVTKLAKGQYMDSPVETKLGWHILLARDTRSVQFGSFESKKESLAKSLQERYDRISKTSVYKGLDFTEMFFSFPSGPPVVRRLIANNIDLELRASNGFTPLVGACVADSLTNLQLLVAANADPRTLSKQGYSPLGICMLSKRDPKKMMSVLLDGGAPPDQRDMHELTALDYTAISNLPQAAELLLQRGASVDLTGHDGMTPLMHAANHDANETLAVLLKYGADPLKKMQEPARNDNTAVSWASKGSGRSHSTLPTLRETASDLIRKKSTRTIEAFVIQGATRHVLDGSPLTLKRAPFILELRLNQGQDVMFHAAYDEGLITRLNAHDSTVDFGNADSAVHAGEKSIASLVISNPQRFAFEHLRIRDAKSMPSATGSTDAGTKGLLQIQYFEELADPENASSTSTRKINFSQLNRPLYLVTAVGESIGFPYTVPTQFKWAKISWK